MWEELIKEVEDMPIDERDLDQHSSMVLSERNYGASVESRLNYMRALGMIRKPVLRVWRPKKSTRLYQRDLPQILRIADEELKMGSTLVEVAERIRAERGRLIKMAFKDLGVKGYVPHWERFEKEIIINVNEKCFLAYNLILGYVLNQKVLESLSMISVLDTEIEILKEASKIVEFCDGCRKSFAGHYSSKQKKLETLHRELSKDTSFARRLILSLVATEYEEPDHEEFMVEG